MTDDGVLDQLKVIARELEQGFRQSRRVLSFQQYLELFAQNPARYARNAARYVRDCFDHYGKRTVEHAWGRTIRYNLFDLPFLDTERRLHEALVGQEGVQNELYRALNNFVREGRANRVPMMHGPNGSAKSTVARCLMMALEDYSAQEAGALYRFHWVFPTKRSLKGTIGFGGGASRDKDPTSYAQLADEAIDTRLFIEVRDHPLFLLPVRERETMIRKCFGVVGTPVAASEWLMRGELSHKNKAVYEALLASYDGSLEEVLRHVQVERYFISRRYRTGAVTVGPQMTVDASERQLTADRSLSALPSALQAINLYEAHGELVDASGGLLEFSDLLKRPLETFRYLQSTVETGEVPLTSQTILLNCVMLASANELQLAAFREHHEFESFRGRLELIRAGYLLNWQEEQTIYDQQISKNIRRHVAPHATRMAAMFAVLTRLRRPDPKRHRSELHKVVGRLTAAEKMDLYATGKPPQHLEPDSVNLLISATAELYEECERDLIYEGATGASPREMRTVLFDAAQSTAYESLSPFAVLEELKELCERTSDYAWLQLDRQEGGYHDHEHFREVLRVRLLDTLEEEFRAASGLVEEVQHRDLFHRYVTHVNHWIRKEKVRNEVTGENEEPDASLLNDVEKLLNVQDGVENWRHSIMSRIAAWAIENPGAPVNNAVVFAEQIRRLRDAVFQQRRGAVARATLDVLKVIRDNGVGLSEPEQAAAQAMIRRLSTEFGYNDASAADAAGALVRERLGDLLG